MSHFGVENERNLFFARSKYILQGGACFFMTEIPKFSPQWDCPELVILRFRREKPEKKMEMNKKLEHFRFFFREKYPKKKLW